MPIYEYACKQCGRAFEALVRSNERPACPDCGSRALEKQLSTFNAGASRSALPSCAGSMSCCQAGRCEPERCGRLD